MESKTVEEPLFLHEKFQGNDRSLSITISPTTDLGSAVYQKEETIAEEYLAGGTIHYIFTNTNNVLAVWNTESYSIAIAGYISQEEMKKIIDSVY